MRFPVRFLLLMFLTLTCSPVSYEYTGPLPSVNIILICVDTLRADAVGSYGSPDGMTPNLDEFAEESVRFANCESPSPWTFPCCTAVLTGLYPIQTGASYESKHMSDSITTLAEIMRRAGYETVAITNNGWLSEEVGMSQGYVTHIEEVPDHESRIPYTTAEKQFRTALDWLDSADRDRPFYMYIHLMDIHLPYAPPEPYRSRFRQGSGRYIEEFHPANNEEVESFDPPENEREQVRGLYNGCVAYEDSEIGIFLNRLQGRELWDDTAVIIFSDHGEEFWEHGDYEHGHSLYEELTHVPLIMKLPGQEPGVRTERVSLIDVTPTILGIASIDAGDDLPGYDLFSDEIDPDRVMFAEGCRRGGERKSVISGDWKLIIDFENNREPELYNLASDPEERNNLFEIETAVVRELAEDIAEFLELDLLGDTSTHELSPETEEQLRSLGYI